MKKIKLAVFDIRQDEEVAFETWCRANQEVEIVSTPDELTLANIDLIAGADGLVLSRNRPLAREIYDRAKQEGVKVFATRSAGFDLYDLDLMKDYGIKMTNVPSYSPNAIAEHCVATALYLSRNIPAILKRVAHKNFSWQSEILSREIRTMTVGIIGVGRIGSQAARLFGALGAKVIGYDIVERDEFRGIVDYQDSADEVIKNADILTIHIPGAEEYRHMINEAFLAKMRDGAILVNAARGMLLDTQALIHALDSGKLLGAAIDVYENEAACVPLDLSGTDFKDDLLQQLIDREDVIYTPHTAFYTHTAIENLVEGGLTSALEVAQTGTCANIVNP